MKRVIYKTLRIQNFLSVGNDEIRLDIQQGINLITGKNLDNPERVNGIGKSTVQEAFFFALFGETIRKVKKEFLVNNVTKGKGRIELEFDVATETGATSYKIVRQVKPSKVSLWKGEEDITNSTISTNKDFIIQLIGTNPTVCKNCDILSLSDNVPFMLMKPEDKRTFINDIFSFEIFGKMMKDLKKMVTANNTEMGITSAKIEEINNSIETIRKQEEAYRKQLEERENILKERKRKVEEQIEEISKEIDGIKIGDSSKLDIEREKFETGLEKIEAKVDSINSKISEADTKRKLKLSDKRKNASVGGAKCSECLQDIPHSHIEHLTKINEELEREIAGYVTEIEKLNVDKDEFLKKKSLIQKKISQLQRDINEINVNKQKLKNLERSLAEYKENLKTILEDSKPPEAPIFEQSKKDTEDRKDKEVEKLTLLKQTSEDYDVCKFILSEEGVKSFAVKKLLGMLNASIQKYISELGMTMRCKFDEYLEETLTNYKGDELSFGNFSGGERKTIDLACKWAFKDIRSKISGITSNLEFCDEIFDSAFDERGLDLLVETVKCRIEKNNLSVYAISHRKEMLKHIDGEIVNLEMNGGISRRVG